MKAARALLGALIIYCGIAGQTAAEVIKDRRFCVELVKGGGRGQVESLGRGYAHGVDSDLWSFPRHAQPVVLDHPSRSVFVVDENAALVPYPSPFPSWPHGLNRFVVEEGGRVVGISTEGLFVLEPGETVFRRLDEYAPPEKYSGALEYLPAHGITLVGRSGNWFVLRGERLEPWSAWDALKRQHGVEQAGIRAVPGTGAVIALENWLGGFGSRIFLMTEEEPWRVVGELKHVFWTPYGGPSPLQGMLLKEPEGFAFENNQEGFWLPPSTAGEAMVVFRSERDLKASVLSSATGRFVVADRELAERARSSTYLLHLTESGLAPVPGDRVTSGSFTFLLWDLASIGRLAVQPSALVEGLWLYDGERADRVRLPDDLRHEQIFVRELPAIGRTLLLSRHGIYDLSSEGAVSALDIPFSLGDRLLQIVNWSDERVALAFTTEGVFVIRPDLSISRASGSKVAPHWKISMGSVELPAREAMLVPAGRHLALVTAHDVENGMRCD